MDVFRDRIAAMLARVMKMQWPPLDRFLGRAQAPSELSGIAELARAARMEIEAAQAQFGEVADHDLVDHAIYRLRAAERHYVYVLRLARGKGNV